MSKLLAKFAASRSAIDAAKVVAYDRKHPMASVMLSNDEVELLQEARKAAAA